MNVGKNLKQFLMMATSKEHFQNAAKQSLPVEM